VSAQLLLKLTHHGRHGVVPLKGRDDRCQQLRELAVDRIFSPLRGGVEPNERIEQSRRVAPASCPS
jgi:hypothetical protein